MGDKRSGPDVVGLLVLILALAAVVGSLYFISRLSETAMNFIAGAAALAIVGIPSTLGMYWLSRRDRPAAPAPDAYDVDRAPDQRSYILERKQAAQLAELELRETKIEYAREMARARMLPPGQAAPEWTPDTLDATRTTNTTNAGRRYIVLGDDSDG